MPPKTLRGKKSVSQGVSPLRYGVLSESTAQGPIQSAATQRCGGLHPIGECVAFIAFRPGRENSFGNRAMLRASSSAAAASAAKSDLESNSMLFPLSYVGSRKHAGLCCAEASRCPRGAAARPAPPRPTGRIQQVNSPAALRALRPYTVGAAAAIPTDAAPGRGVSHRGDFNTAVEEQPISHASAYKIDGSSTTVSIL